MAQMSIQGLTARDRTDELLGWVQDVYGAEIQALRLYLCGFARIEAQDPAWIVADTEHHVFWRHWIMALNRLNIGLTYITKLKCQRPREAAHKIEDLGNRRSERQLFIETGWRNKFVYSPRHRIDEVEREVLRRRIYCRPVSPIGDGMVDQLTARMEKWLRLTLPSPIPASSTPLCDYQLVLCELLGKIGPQTADSIGRNMLAINTAYSYINAPVGEEEANLQLYRTLVESTRPWDKKLMEAMAVGDGMRSIEQLAGSIDGRDKRQVVKMLRPWVEKGLVDWRKKRLPSGRIVDGRWIGTTPLGSEMIRLLRGEARWW